MRPVSWAGLFVLPDISLAVLAPEHEPEALAATPAALPAAAPGRTTAPAPAAAVTLSRFRRERSSIVRSLSIGLRRSEHFA
jgi:hypothetical protein